MVKRNAGQYTLVDGNLFRHGYTHPILTCLSGYQCARIMAELHEGICGSHIGERTLSLKVIRVRYYYPTVKEDHVKYAQRCEQCQKHADWHHALAEELRSIYSPWPLYTWGIDILGHFPLVIRQMKYLIIAIKYFTKWVEAEQVAQIISHKVQHFVWKNIVCRFRILRHLVSDNGTQFASQQLGKLCSELGIKKIFPSVEHPQTNGQFESTNKVLLRGLKKAKGTCSEEVSRILWVYDTTPQSTTKETPFSLVYGSDAMIPVEIQEISHRFQRFVVEESNKGRKVDLLDEVREHARINSEALKRRVELRQKTKTRPR